MRGLTPLEHEELAALLSPGERVFHGPTLDALLTSGRAREYDHDGDGMCRIAPSEAGLLALRLWPLVRVG